MKLYESQFDKACIAYDTYFFIMKHVSEKYALY